MLTYQQRRLIEEFLAPLQTWTISIAQNTGLHLTVSFFAPRLHDDGDIDFVSAYRAGSPKLTSIVSTSTVTFLVSDGTAERWLQGLAQAALVATPWGRAVERAYLQRRAPGVINVLDDDSEVVLFRPTYLRYCDRRRGGEFDLRWQR